MAGAILSSSLLSGQGKWGADSVQCYENYQIYYQMYKSKQYASAYEGWNYVYTNCPEATKNTFIFGPKIIKGQIKATTDPVAQAELVGQLIAMYQKRLDVFPGKEGYVYGQQGMDLMKYKKEEPKEAYDAFMKAYAADPANLPAGILDAFFKSAARLYNKKVFSVEEVFATYNLGIRSHPEHNRQHLPQAGLLRQNARRQCTAGCQAAEGHSCALAGVGALRSGQW